MKFIALVAAVAALLIPSVAQGNGTVRELRAERCLQARASHFRQLTRAYDQSLASLAQTAQNTIDGGPLGFLEAALSGSITHLGVVVEELGEPPRCRKGD